MNPYEKSIRAYQDSLAVEYLPAVKNLAYRMKSRLPLSVDFDDLVAVATEELIKVSRRYDPKQNDNFWGYARRRVEGAMLDYLRSLDIVSRGNRKIIKDIEKEIDNINKKIEEEELIEIIKKELYKMDKREQMVIQLYYFEELSLREISEILDISESKISQIHKSVVRKIRENLNG
jgi:RNA polymerase sigma factor for flagellar operon FliA